MVRQGAIKYVARSDKPDFQSYFDTMGKQIWLVLNLLNCTTYTGTDRIITVCPSLKYTLNYTEC